MQTQEQSSATQTALFISMALTAWEAQNSRVDKFIADLTDEQLMQPIAPGKNRVVYLFGHLAGVNDNLFPLFGLGDRLHTSLYDIFVTSPDNTTKEYPPIPELKAQWKEINETLTTKFRAMTAEDWFSRHTAVSEADFAKEPHRNKLNVLLNRTSHQAYHVGQMILVKGKGD